MWSLVIALVLAVISFFGSRKAGASDGKAALVAAGVGAGSYYVGTQTQWGRDLITKVDGVWQDWKGSDGQPTVNPVTNKPDKVPPGAQVEVGEDGQPVRDSNGNLIWKVVDSTGKVLESWGPAGTAGVITAGSLMSTVKKNPLPWLAGGGVILLLILRK